jgi:hypothetical protein
VKLRDIITDKLPVSTKKPIKKHCNCCVCGDIVDEVIPCLTNTFTDREKLKSGDVCRECSRLFSDDYRKSAFYITENEARRIQQGEIEKILFQTIEFPCLLSFSESRKKHRLFKTIPSLSKEAVHISTDTAIVTVDTIKDSPLFQTMSDFYNSHKVSKAWIETGKYPVSFYISVGKIVIDEFEDKVKEYRGSLKFSLFVKLLNKYEK